MSESGDWTPYFENVQKVPGSKHQQPAKKTYEEVARDTEFARKRYTANVAVGLGAVDTGDDFDPLDWLSEFGSTVTENTEAIADLNAIAAASRSTQAYLADIQDMPTCPRRDLAAFGYGTLRYIDIEGGVYCAFDDHFHKVGTTCITPGTVRGEGMGTLYYTPIIVDRIGALQGLRWFVGIDTVLNSISYYEVALCVYNPDNGNIEKLWGSGNIKDSLPSTTSMVEAYVEFDFETDQMTAPGQILFFAHQQTASGFLMVARRLAAAINPPAGRPDQLLDAACYTKDSYTQGIPSTISLASLDRENDFIPWGAVRVTTAVDGS